MSDSEPIMLELAQLPRDQLGPFLLLGLPKTATLKDLDAHWAERLKWARKNLIKVALEDINWAREILMDPKTRAEADVSSLTADLTDDMLRRMAQKYHVEEGQSELSWEPMDEEKDLQNYEPVVEIPDIETIRSQVQIPTIPEEMPSAQLFLTPLEAADLDPWDVKLPGDE